MATQTIPPTATTATTTPADPFKIDTTQLAKAPTQDVAAATMGVDPDKTVNGLLAKYLKTSNPIMQQAEATARQAANSRGLANSSLAVGAAQQAVTNSMLPVAQQDATTYNNAEQFNANAENSARQFTAGAVNSANQQQAGLVANALTQNASMGNQSAQFNAQQANAQSQFNASQQNELLKTTLDMNNRETLAGIEANYKTLMQANSSAGELYQQAVKNITDIQSNKDMDATTKASAIQNQLSYLKTGVDMIGKMDNIPGLDGLLNFGTSAPTPAPTFAADASTSNSIVKAALTGAKNQIDKGSGALDEMSASVREQLERIADLSAPGEAD